MCISTSFAQNLLNNTSFSIGYGIQQQDRRLFDFPPRFEREVVPLEESIVDQSFSIQLNKKIISTRKFSVKFGLGYNRFVSKFTRPFNHHYFRESERESILLYIDSYTKQQIQSPVEVSYIIPFEKSSVGVNLLILPHYNFHKKVVTTWSKENIHKQFEFSFDGIEVNPGISYQVNRVSFNLHYRLFNLMSIDRIIFYSSLFRTRSERIALAETNFETNNPTKFWLFVSYDF